MDDRPGNHASIDSNGSRYDPHDSRCVLVLSSAILSKFGQLVYALYNKNNKLLAVMSVLFIGEISFLSYVLAFVTPRLTFNDDCFVTSSPPLFVAYWCVIL